MEKKLNIWIINHYAIPPSLGGLVRHYYFARYLRQQGHNVKLFTSSKIHNTDVNMIKDDSQFKEINVDGQDYTFVKSSEYNGNGISRVKNMCEFARKVAKFPKYFDKPDIIYTSSPDLLTARAAIKLAKKLGIPVVTEIRDLWPESIVEYNNISKHNPLIQMLYLMEKKVYQKSDKIVFTFPGGSQYIKDRKWDSNIDLNKICNVNNGVDLEEFHANQDRYQLVDEDLANSNIFKAIYTGSIRKVNHIEKLVDVARILKNRSITDIKLIIYGDGTEKEMLESICKNESLDNIVFKGRVEKKYIPYVLSCSDLNLIQVQQTKIMRYGCSLNKLFDYIASGKPILSDLVVNHDLIKEHNLGKVIETQEPEAIADGILEFRNMSADERSAFSENCKRTIVQYDYNMLASKVEQILYDTMNK